MQDHSRAQARVEKEKEERQKMVRKITGLSSMELFLRDTLSNILNLHTAYTLHDATHHAHNALLSMAW